MLIGCCHCDEKSESSIPSESIPSEESQSVNSESVGSGSASESSASVDESIPPGPCGACDINNGYRPAMMRISWDLEQQDPPSALFDTWPDNGGCYDDYTGPFEVHHDRGDSFDDINTLDGIGLPPGSIECFYGSIERPLKSEDCSAAVGDGSARSCRAYVWLVKSGTGAYGVYALILWFNFEWPFTESLAGGGIWYNSGAITALDCFGSYTLHYERMHNLLGSDSGGISFRPGPGFNYEYVTDAPSYEFTFPETITVTAI